MGVVHPVGKVAKKKTVCEGCVFVNSVKNTLLQTAFSAILPTTTGRPSRDNYFPDIFQAGNGR